MFFFVPEILYNKLSLSDNLACSLNDNITNDIIYFDVAKAFDSVNHDLILEKLKFRFNIDGKMLKFIKNYLMDRSQRVVVGNEYSSYVPVMSGVPQGSISGPILFVLFINDIGEGLSSGTNLSLYADDTKIWRAIHSEHDCIGLQSDIDYLFEWSLNNKMQFHPNKCKVLSVAFRDPPLLGILPLIHFTYTVGGIQLDYMSHEKDLGIHITSKLNWSLHQEKILIKASQMLGLTKRTCHFVQNVDRKRALYLAMVRSQFNHCSVIWRPHNKTMLNKFERIQKQAVKWILSEEYISYSSHYTYI